MQPLRQLARQQTPRQGQRVAAAALALRPAEVAVAGELIEVEVGEAAEHLLHIQMVHVTRRMLKSQLRRSNLMHGIQIYLPMRQLGILRSLPMAAGVPLPLELQLQPLLRPPM